MQGLAARRHSNSPQLMAVLAQSFHIALRYLAMSLMIDAPFAQGLVLLEPGGCHELPYSHARLVRGLLVGTQPHLRQVLRRHHFADEKIDSDEVFLQAEDDHLFLQVLSEFHVLC